MLEIKVETEGSVKLKGRLDAASAPKAREALRPLKGPMALDLSDLEYISSAGIGVVVETYKRLHGEGAALRVLNLTPGVRAVFRFAGLEQMLAIE
ncbi:MAG TPA: STAS domain-containing protein [Candidatus Eisenbacteria bacterium]|jgi:anti-anti-sigma factor|nr:STAS domain-containing protein [Candidatus Eisenbacteria bacterium]